MSTVSSMLNVAPSSRWQMTRSGLVTSMSPVVWIMPAVTSVGPVADRWSRRGPSPSILSAICFTLSTMSVRSSRTPARLENSCSTPSILIEVTAAPCSEERSTRRSELPSVMPKPRSSGSATNAARRRLSPPDCFFSSALGFLSSCQFFALTAICLPALWRDVSRRYNPCFAAVSRGSGASDELDAPPLRRPDPVVRDRGHVADAGDRETDGLEGAKSALPARAGSLDLNLEGADAMLGGLAARVLGRDLRGIRGRLTAALEAHHAGARPGNRIALRVGDGDHGVVEAGVHVGDAGRDVLALSPAEALRCLGH